jgi:hypothetical protein
MVSIVWCNKKPVGFHNHDYGTQPGELNILALPSRSYYGGYTYAFNSKIITGTVR